MNTPGFGKQGFDAAEFKQIVEAAGGDVTAAVKGWLVDTGRMRPEAVIVYLEISRLEARRLAEATACQGLLNNIAPTRRTRPGRGN